MSAESPTPVEWTALARAARRGEAVEEELPSRQLLTFELAGATYALPVERVREIVRVREWTPIPRVPAAVRGAISLRGEIVQVIDLRRRLGLPPGEPVERHRVVVVHGDTGRVTGLCVDGVREVLRAREDSLRPPPGGDAGCVEALCKAGSGFVSLVDLDRVLDLDDER